MTQVRDLNTLLGLIGEGQSIQEVNNLWPEAMQQLVEMSEDQPKKTFKGSVTLKVNVEVKFGVAEVSLDVNVKLPKRPSRSSIFWLTKDGYFTDEHPRQINMFPDRKKVIDGTAVDKPEDLTATG